MDAIQILDKAIAEINSMRNISLYQGRDAVKGGEEIKSIARRALMQIGATQQVLDNLNRISFGDDFLGRHIASDAGIGAMVAGLTQTYQNGLQMVVNLLQQQRDLRVERMENNRQDLSLKYSKIAIAVSILSLLAALFK